MVDVLLRFARSLVLVTSILIAAAESVIPVASIHAVLVAEVVIVLVGVSLVFGCPRFFFVGVMGRCTGARR